MALKPHGIVRLGYVRIALADEHFDNARAFYRDTLGLVEDSRSSDQRLLLRCWHEAHPYSMVVDREPTSALIETAFEVASVEDLDCIATRVRQQGYSARECAADAWLPQMGASYVCDVPGGLKIRVFVAGKVSPTFLVGHVAPDWVTPRNLRATAAPLFLNHVGVTVPEPIRTVKFMQECFEFSISEKIESDDGEQLISALLFRMSKDVGGQEIAIFTGSEGGLHHIAFAKEDFNDILVDAQNLREARTKMDPLGPTRQLYGKTFSLFFYDPAGTRFELCSGGRLTESHPEFEPVVWTESHFDRAISFYDSPVPQGFLRACF